MGLSIYYSGKLRNPELISDIITEDADIGDSLHWNITELPSAPGIPVRGIILQPENCDPLWLTLNENLVVELYHSVFPDDIFINQDYFDTWVKVGADTIVKFADDLSSIEVNVLSELN